MINKSGVIWVSGYSASGKTNVGRKLEMKLRADGLPTIFLDGDDLRSIFDNRWGYEREERIELAKVYFRLSSHLSNQGYVVIIAAVAMYDEVRQWFKSNIPNSYEVYLDVPVEERIRRDKETKGLYKKNKDFTSIYEEPREPDLVVENYDKNTPDSTAELIKEYFYNNESNRFADRGKKTHWNSYYKQAIAPSNPSSFAVSVADKISSASKVLEVGCGNGRDAVYLSAQGNDMIALDASEAAIKFCRKQYEDMPINFLSGTISNLMPENEANFDVIYTRFCLHAMTIREEKEFFNVASELLCPNGEIHIECRSINDPLARKGEVISPTERIYGHYRRFIIIDELLQNLVSAGFEVKEAIEAKGLAKYKDDDPVVIRVSAKIAT